MTIDRWRSGFILIAACCGAAALLIGLVTHGILYYDRRALGETFVIFLAGTAGFPAAARFGIPGIVLAALAAAALIFGPGATGVLVLTLVTALAIGILLSRLLRLKPPADPALGIVTGFAVMVGILQIIMHVPVNWSPVYLIATSVAIVATRADLMAYADRLRPVSVVPANRLAHLPGAILFGALLAASAYGTGPETGYDALSNHLVVISWVGWHGFFHFDPTLFDRSLMPRGAGWLFTWCHVLGGEPAVRLMNVACLWLSVAVVTSFATSPQQRDLAPPALTTLGLVTFVTTPVVVAVTSLLYEEPVTTLFVTAALVHLLRSWREPADTTSLKLTFLLLGAACASKIQALFFGGIGLAAIVAQISGFGWYQGVRRSIIGALFFAAVGLLPYVLALVLTGNPFYPFSFGKPFDQLYVGRFSTDLLYRMVFDTSRYLEARDGAFGFAPLLIYPIALIGGLVARRPGERAVALALLLFIVAMLSQAQYARYQVYALPGLLLLLPTAWAGTGRIGRSVMVAGLSLSVLLNMLAYRSVTNPTFSLRKLLQPTRFATSVPQERMIVTAINAMYGPQAVVYFAGLPFQADLIGRGITVYSDLRHAIDTATSIDAVGDILASHGVTHVITATAANGNQPPVPVQPLLETFLAKRMIEIPLTLREVRLFAYPQHPADGVSRER